MITNVKETGVYAIRNTVNGKRYIGSAATGFGNRWNKHRSDLRNNKHHSRHLQASWNKYGESAFVFEVVEVCHPRHATAVEQVMIDHYQASDSRRGFNIAPRVSSPLGIKRSQETKDKISRANKGLKRSPEHIAKMRLRKMSQLCREKLDAVRGRPVTNETRQKMSLSQTGRKHSPETRQKMSAAMTGLKRSAEGCRNISIAKKGKTMSEEQKRKISASTKGRKKSPKLAQKCPRQIEDVSL